MTYVALLRGINVSGQKIVKMETLRAALEEAGFKSVRTYVQSGNIVLDATKSTNTKIAQSVGAVIQKKFGFAVHVLVKTAEEWKKVQKANPFLKRKGIDLTKLHLSFLSDTPKIDALKKLSTIQAGKDEFQCVGSEVYLHCPDGYGRSKLTNNVIERNLGLDVTTRNWNTILALGELLT